MAASPIAASAAVLELCQDAVLHESIREQLATLRQEIDRCVKFLPVLKEQLTGAVVPA